MTNAGGKDRSQDAVEIFANVVVPEAQHAPAMRVKSGVSDAVIFRRCMLATVDLDDELDADAGEIDDVPINRMLPAETERKKRLLPKASPEDCLLARSILAQFLCCSD